MKLTNTSIIFSPLLADDLHHSADNSYAMISLPVGKAITIATTNFDKQIIAWWFNPKDASIQKIGIMENKGSMEFITPTIGFGNDWVLIIDDAKKGYPAPATPLK